MVNIASVLKTEIARVARKEVRTEIESLKKANSQYRSAMAQLRRELADVQKQLKQQGRAVAKQTHAARTAVAAAGSADGVPQGPARRFSASRLAAHRAKLGLSAATYGALVGHEQCDDLPLGAGQEPPQCRAAAASGGGAGAEQGRSGPARGELPRAGADPPQVFWRAPQEECGRQVATLICTGSQEHCMRSDLPEPILGHVQQLSDYLRQHFVPLPD